MNQETPNPNNSDHNPPAKPEPNKIKPEATDKRLYGDRETANFSERNHKKND